MKSFNQLSKKEQIRLIALDVLQQLDKGTFIPSTRLYLNLKLPETSESQTITLSRMNTDATCYACAIGGAFLSLCNLTQTNKKNIKSLECIVRQHGENDDERNEYGFSEEMMRVNLSQIFSHEQLALIETAFEAKNFEDRRTRGVNERLLKAAVRFGDKYTNPKNRLIAIMRNILENNGCFIPPLRKKDIKALKAEIGYAKSSSFG
jgi:hypothetical protein